MLSLLIYIVGFFILNRYNNSNDITINLLNNFCIPNTAIKYSDILPPCYDFVLVDNSYKKLKAGDLIYSINSVIVKSREDFDKEIKNVLWGNEVKVGVIRKGRKLIIRIKTTSLYNYRLRTIELGIGFKKSKDKFLKVSDVAKCSSVDNIVKKGDIILNLISNVNGIKNKIKIFSGDHLYKEVNEKFSGMINAFSYGAPPHGGIAPGIDRIIMLLANEKNIREVTMFPMNQNAQDLMMNAPSSIDEKQLKELNLAFKIKK